MRKSSLSPPYHSSRSSRRPGGPGGQTNVNPTGRNFCRFPEQRRGAVCSQSESRKFSVTSVRREFTAAR
ncbi:hypothetical protein NDU88_005025 [Pleurodeles waltl]|uniref:Uncharacterized protein n=1 Tax=Pleurodeles waltl TaxID=8319 RepID=A0AAV7PJ81_PLEWA|nr:hypothetical protein NDU88_005025 [Pleurodeles waltl]